MEAQALLFEWEFLVIKLEEVMGHLRIALLPLIPSEKRPNLKRMAAEGVSGALDDE